MDNANADKNDKIVTRDIMNKLQNCINLNEGRKKKKLSLSELNLQISNRDVRILLIANLIDARTISTRILIRLNAGLPKWYMRKFVRNNHSKVAVPSCMVNLNSPK